MVAGIYWRDGVPVYAREDRGPFRVFYLEAGARAAQCLWEENAVRDRALRRWSIRWRFPR